MRNPEQPRVFAPRTKADVSKFPPHLRAVQEWRDFLEGTYRNTEITASIGIVNDTYEYF
jgi:hypothetical protein